MRTTVRVALAAVGAAVLALAWTLHQGPAIAMAWWGAFCQ